jgi:hypothetical protein
MTNLIKEPGLSLELDNEHLIALNHSHTIAAFKSVDNLNKGLRLAFKCPSEVRCLTSNLQKAQRSVLE